MTPEEAIQTALQYERKIRDLYVEAADAVADETGRQLFRSLAKDEQGHVDYLEDRLSQWQKDGAVSLDNLPESLNLAEKLTRELEKIKKGLAEKDHGLEQQMLSKALKAETDTSQFYKEMVEKMTGDTRKMFARFLEIEDDHVKIVQAQLDYMMNTGYWFDIKEFDME